MVSHKSADAENKVPLLTMLPAPQAHNRGITPLAAYAHLLKKPEPKPSPAFMRAIREAFAAAAAGQKDLNRVIAEMLGVQ